MRPLLVGGPQEEGRRPGTENVAGVLAMLAALEAREGLIGSSADRLAGGAKLQFEKHLPDKLPGTEIVGAGTDRLWNTVCAIMSEAGCRQRWVVKLDKLGFAVSTGSACASGKEEPSHVMDALGYAPEEAARALRFSGGWETTPEEWDQLLEALCTIATN